MIGCGAYKNPPEIVSEIFKELVVEFAGYFNMVVFAITENWRDPEPLNNYNLFSEHFGTDEHNYKNYYPTPNPSPKIDNSSPEKKINDEF